MEFKDLSAVFYGDGSARPNPGYSGFGYHGYIYKDGVTPKAQRPNEYTPTNVGYLKKLSNTFYFSINKKKEDIKEVEVIKYIDGIGAIIEGTNNIGELEALINILKFANLEGLSKVTIFLDSQYTIDTYNKITRLHVSEIKKNTRANLDTILKLKYTYIDIKDNCEIIVDKIKAHIGELGNELADDLALIGRLEASRGKEYDKKVYSEPKQYWKPKYTKNPFLSFRRLFFDIDNLNSFVVMNYKKEREIGKIDSESLMAYIKSNIDDGLIKDILNLYKDLGIKVLSYLDTNILYNSYLLKLYSLFGNIIFITDNNGVRFLTQDYLAKPVYPRGLSNLLYAKINKLKITLDIDDSTGIIEYDITDKFYNGNKLLLDTKTKDIKIPLKEIYELNIDKGNIILTVGKTIFPRNALKFIEKDNPSIKLKIVKESGVLYYDVVVKSDKITSIVTNLFLNKVLI